MSEKKPMIKNCCEECAPEYIHGKPSCSCKCHSEKKSMTVEEMVEQIWATPKPLREAVKEALTAAKAEFPEKGGG